MVFNGDPYLIILPIWQYKFMAPKRSCTSTSYDADKFVSMAASNCYDQSLLKKVPIAERGFNIQESDFPNFDIIIRQWGRTQLCKHPKSAFIPLVHKFYANAYEQQRIVVQVQGKQVKFGHTILNHFYSLQDIKYDEYTRATMWTAQRSLKQSVGQVDEDSHNDMDYYGDIDIHDLPNGVVNHGEINISSKIYIILVSSLSAPSA